MPAIITNDHRIVAADYFQKDLTRVPTYVFIGGTSEWQDEPIPPNVDDSTLDRIFATEEMLGLKRIQQNDIISVLPREDWQSGTVYDEYTDQVNMIDRRNPETDEFYKFYVVTSEFNVYKCISNNYRSTSTVMPSGTSINTFQTPDGYVWKYMYTIKAPDAFTYMTPNWVPCYSLTFNDDSAQWLTQTSAVPGTIDNIIVQDGGANYSSSTPPDVVITGNGTGASAIAEIDDIEGTITAITVTDPGQNYTQASVEITNTNGSGVGAGARPVISPINGHGSDARSELGATYKMIRVTFEGTEGSVLPIGDEYRKAGILELPLHSTKTGIYLSVNNSSLYEVGETVEGQTSGATGTVYAIDYFKDYIYLTSVTGVFSQDELVESQPYNTTQVKQVFETDHLPIVAPVAASGDYKDHSGNVLYFSTREKITRGFNQTEEIRFVISF